MDERSEIHYIHICRYVGSESSRTGFLLSKRVDEKRSARTRSVEDIGGKSAVYSQPLKGARHFFCEPLSKRLLSRRVMERRLVQWYVIKFCVKPGKTGKETHDKILKAFGDTAIAKSGVFKLNKLFREGRNRMEDDDPPPSRTPFDQHDQRKHVASENEKWNGKKQWIVEWVSEWLLMDWAFLKP